MIPSRIKNDTLLKLNKIGDCMSELIKRTEIINPETGEIVNSDTQKIKREIKKDVIKYKSRNKFTKMFCDVVPEFSSSSFFGYFYILISKMEKYSNVILAKHNNVFMAANKKDIVEYLSISERTYKRFISEANKIGAIAITRIDNQTCYTINPAYSYNGIGIAPGLYWVFQENKDFIRSLTKDNVNDLCFIFKKNIWNNIKELHPEIYAEKFE